MSNDRATVFSGRGGLMVAVWAVYTLAAFGYLGYRSALAGVFCLNPS